MEVKFRPMKVENLLAEKPKRKPVKKTTRKSILEKQHGKCWRCHKSIKQKRVRPYIHHRDMNKRNNSLKNLAIVCPDCHDIIHQRIKKVPRRVIGRYGLYETKYIKKPIRKKTKGKKKKRRRRKSWLW